MKGHGTFGFVTKGLEADVLNLESASLLSFDLCTGVGVFCGSQGFSGADQSDGLLVVVGGPLSVSNS